MRLVMRFFFGRKKLCVRLVMRFFFGRKKLCVASLSRVPAFKRGEVLIMQRMDYINSAISVEGGGL
jgi:hypothetical protein